MTTSQLAAIVDGKPLEAAEAKSLWERFSTYMDAHQGDFDGFARQEDMLSARVAVVQGTPTLTLASASAPQAADPKPPTPQAGASKARKKGRRRKRRKRQKPGG